MNELKKTLSYIPWHVAMLDDGIKMNVTKWEDLFWAAVNEFNHEYCRERRRFPHPTPVGSLSIVMLAGVGWVRYAYDRWMTNG